MSQKPYEPSGIAKWSEDDRPREKLFRLGPSKLSDSELLSIILRIGVKGKSAVDLGQEIKRKFKTWRSMADVDETTWRTIKGLGTTKISQLMAAMEIGKRIHQEEAGEGVVIKSGKQLAGYVSPRLRDLKKESFWLFLLDGRNKIRDEIEMAQGTATEVSTYTREIMATALRGAAASFAVAHNHPSGNEEPSDGDINLTRELVHAGQVMKIRLQDHLIIGDKGYYSFAEQGQIRLFEEQWLNQLISWRTGGQNVQEP